MPITVTALTADRRTLSIPFGDDHLVIVYKPSSVNASQEQRELDEREKGLHLMAQARSLAEIIVSWDLQDEHGKTLPATVEQIAPLGLEVTSKITRAIIEDLLPNPQTRSGSSNGSSRMADSEPARSGT